MYDNEFLESVHPAVYVEKIKIMVLDEFVFKSCIPVKTEEISLETNDVSCYRGKVYMIKKSVLELACYIVITYSLSIIFGEIRLNVK